MGSLDHDSINLFRCIFFLEGYVKFIAILTIVTIIVFHPTVLMRLSRYRLIPEVLLHELILSDLLLKDLLDRRLVLLLLLLDLELLRDVVVPVLGVDGLVLALCGFRCISWKIFQQKA